MDRCDCCSHTPHFISVKPSLRVDPILSIAESRAVPSISLHKKRGHIEVTYLFMCLKLAMDGSQRERRRAETLACNAHHDITTHGERSLCRATCAWSVFWATSRICKCLTVDQAPTAPLQRGCAVRPAQQYS